MHIEKGLQGNIKDERKLSVGIFIPMLNAAVELMSLLPALARMQPTPDRVLFVDSSSTDNSCELVREAGYECEVIKREDFGHGRTRNIALERLDVDIILYLTQDALPQGHDLIERILEGFDDPNVAHIVARQLPRDDATLSARFSRLFNYPSSGYKNEKKDFESKGIRAVFTSNSCAAYRRTALASIGGFASGIPSNEDAVAVGQLLQAGYSMIYQSGAEVVHSHNYALTEEFRRYFDTGVAHAVHEMFRSPAKSVGGEGRSYVKSEIRFFLKHNALLLIPALFRDFIRWSGYRTGKAHRFLPLWLKRKCALNRSYWINEHKLIGKTC